MNILKMDACEKVSNDLYSKIMHTDNSEIRYIVGRVMTLYGMLYAVQTRLVVDDKYNLSGSDVSMYKLVYDIIDTICEDGKVLIKNYKTIMERYDRKDDDANELNAIDKLMKDFEDIINDTSEVYVFE